MDISGSFQDSNDVWDRVKGKENEKRQELRGFEQKDWGRADPAGERARDTRFLGAEREPLHHCDLWLMGC
jgi:hypothetical protein